MSQLLRRLSDQLLQWSDCRERHLVSRPPRASSPAPRRDAGPRSLAAGFIGREIQALRSARLSLRQRPGPWTEALSVDQHDRPAAADGLCAECRIRRSQRVPRQLPQGSRHAERDLCDQRRTSAAPRSARLNGLGRRLPRLRQGGRHHRQHDRILSCCRRPAARTGGGR